MKRSFLTAYRMRIRVLTPVHIGSGRSLTKREYIVLPRERKVLVPDLQKLHRFLAERGMLDAFEQYLLMPGTPDLARFLQQQRIAQDQWAAFVAYELDAGAIPNVGDRFEIHLFVKEASGLPYLPGSSVKGALRTALLAQRVAAAPGNPGRNIFAKQAEELEQRHLYTLRLNQQRPSDAVNDVLRGLRISDSAPLPCTALTIARKVDRDAGGHQSELNLYRECLTPGTEVSLALTLDSSFLPPKGFTADDLAQALAGFAAQNDAHFISKFPLQQVDIPQAQTPLYMGGGAGYATKTVSYALYGDRQPSAVGSMMQRAYPKKHRHDRDAGLGVAPHMLKLAGTAERLQPMGLCDVKLEPLEGGAHAAQV